MPDGNLFQIARLGRLAKRLSNQPLANRHRRHELVWQVPTLPRIEAQLMRRVEPKRAQTWTEQTATRRLPRRVALLPARVLNRRARDPQADQPGP